MPHNHTAWALSIFCIMKTDRFGPGLNPQPWVQKANDKPTTPPSRQHDIGPLLYQHRVLTSKNWHLLLDSYVTSDQPLSIGSAPGRRHPFIPMADHT
ncbi:hypothetical protein TNCV_1721601 [Trichonephila clavipes]|nr:hypothetical protein TNCV_1721601 [Trichonephila clavipes]